MSWSVTSKLDPSRWLEHDGTDWTADAETTMRLRDPDFGFMLTPTGPPATVVDDSTLMAGAMKLIPGADVTGDRPSYPSIPSIPGVVY